jgi:hypothetical protein
VPDVDRLLNAIDAEEEHSYGSDSDGELASERATAVDLYLGRNIAPAPEGRSQVVDRSVYESIQWVKPSLSRIFANGDDVVELPPVGPEDEEGAKQEAQFLNHVLLQKNNWFQIFDTASTDALLTKAGYLYPYIEERRQIEIDTYKGQTPESLAFIMEGKPDIVSQKEYPDPDYVEPPPQPMMQPGPDGQPMPVIGPDGQPVMQPPQPAPMLYDVEIRRTKVDKHFCVKALPPERCKISQSTDTVQISRGCPYFEYYDFVTISELREMGYKVEDDIADDENGDTEEDTARDQYSEQNWADKNQLDPSMRRVKCRWVWIRFDYDEDGIAELQYVVRVGRKMLYRQELSRIPVAVLCADPLPHRHVGLCPADIVADIQQTKTAIIRQGLDNLYLSNNPQKFADGKFVNLDDMLVSRPGGTVRLKPGAVFGQNFGVMQVPFVFPQAIEGLGYMDHVRETRTGVNNSFQGLDASQLTQLQPGTVNQISSMAAQRTEQIARNFANGVEELVSILHEIILKSGHKKEVVQLRGEWVTVDPSTWRKRTDFRISVGFAAGNKDAQITRLMMIGNMQKEAMMGGLPIVTPENVYETMNELIKASDLQAPGRFLTHPSKAPQKGPPQPDPTVVAIEQMKSQSAEKIKGAEIQSEQAVTQAKLEVDKYKADLASQTQLAIEQMKAQVSAHLEQQRGETTIKAKHLDAKKGDDELVGTRVRATEAESKAEQLEKQLESSVTELNALLNSLATARRQIKRGKDGKLEGADYVDENGRKLLSKRLKMGKGGKAEGLDILTPSGELLTSQTIVRGPDGRPQGTA